MKKTLFRALTTAVAVTLVLTIQGCGDDPAALLASAQKAADAQDFATATIQIKNVLQKNPTDARARLLFGKVLLAQGDAGGAERELRKALEVGTLNEEVIPLLARAMLESGESKKLTAEFAGKSLATVQGRVSLSSVMIRAYLAQGDNSKATDLLAVATKDAPEDPRIIYDTALLRLVEHKDAEAGRLVDGILAKDPNAAEPLLLKADLLIAAGKADEAGSALIKARDSKPPLPVAVAAQTRLLTLYSSQGRLEDADAAMSALKKLAPRSLQTYYWQARLALSHKEPAKARDSINQVLRVAPEHVPSMILAAMAAMQLGDHLQAQTLLESVVAKNKDMPGPRKLLAQSYLASRNASKALETIGPLLTPDNRDSTIMGLAGQAYLLAGDTKKGQEYLEKEVAFEPSSAMARTRLGVARLAAQDDARAMQDLETAIKLDPSSIQAEAVMIGAYLHKKEIDKALSAAADLEKRQPENPLTFNIKGGVMLAAKDVQGARKSFSRALELQPDNLAAATQLAKLDLADKHPDAARKHFEQILAKDPKNTSAYLLLAQMSAETGQGPDAIRQVLEKGVSADPTEPKLRVALIQLLLQQQDTKGALEQAQKAQAAAPDDLEVLRLLGRTQLATNQTQQAVATLSKVQEMDSSNPASFIELAQAQTASGEMATAEQTLRKAIQTRPDYLQSYEPLVFLLVQQQRADEALKVARDLQSRKPEVIDGYLLEARTLGSQKRWGDSAAVWQKVVQKFKSPEAVMGLYSVDMERNQSEEAKKVANEWLRANPKDPVVRGFLAERALAAKDYREAQMQYAALLTIVPNSPVALNNYAWTLHQLNDPRAQERAEAAVKLSPRSPPILDTLGNILVDRGQVSKGLETIKQAVDLAPKAPDLRLSYAKALSKTGDKSAARREAEQAVKLAPEKSPIRGEAEQLTRAL